MDTHSFVLQLDRTPADAGWFDAFIEAAFPFISDSTPYEQGGVAYLHFAREAPTLRDAVVCAVRGIRQADPAITVCGVILDDGQPLEQLFSPAAATAGT
ncbi:MAG: hypothetical protein M3552_08330 [Planctomycetota bacterium]|nr:hypothetical protein [Planctomycetaceae bacterium]MDQ3330646.1 hypothetical protein [Planctomycetota bacterium]